MATKTVIAPAPNPAVAVYAAPYGAEGPLIYGTSITPNTIDTVVNKTFTIIEYNRSFDVGTRLRATAVGFTDTFLEGVVTAWDGSVVTIDGDLAHNASGVTYSNWTISVAGQPGIQGIAGPTGPQGPSGGAQGPAGPAGAPGSIWRDGSGVPLNSLGVNGDYYLNDLTGDVYLRAASIYSITANIHGAAGSTGPAGPVGPTGPQGIVPDAPNDGGYYARRNLSWQTPPGGGNVSVAGSPTAGQLAQWTSPNTIQGIAVTYGNLSNSGTPTVNQWAQFVDATHVQGVAASAMPFVQKAGDTMSGSLVLAMDNPILGLRKNAAGQSSAIYGRNGNLLRWQILVGDQSAETGPSNTGSDFSVGRYDDTGVFIDSPLVIARNSGLVALKADPTQPLGAATKQYVDTRTAPFFPTCGRLLIINPSTLGFNACFGSYIKINGVIYNFNAGVTSNKIGCFVNGVAGQNLAPSGFYFVFVFNNAGTLALDFRNDSTRTFSQTSGNYGTPIRTGDDTRTFVGLVGMDSSAQFWIVRSFFNRLGFTTTANVANFGTNATSMTNYVGNVAPFVAFNDEIITYYMEGIWYVTVSGQYGIVQVSLDSGPPGGVSVLQSTVLSDTAATNTTNQTKFANVLDGFHSLYWNAMSSVSGNTLQMFNNYLEVKCW